jgi:hypothetical protein
MGDDIVPQNAKLEVFGWLMAVFFSGTVFFVLCLQTIIRQLRSIEDRKSKKAILIPEDDLRSLSRKEIAEHRSWFWPMADIAQRLRKATAADEISQSRAVASMLS